MAGRTVVILVVFFLCALQIKFCESKKSLEHFIRTKNINHSRITLLNVPNDEINYTWIEYHYSFNDINKNSNHNLNQDLFNVSNDVETNEFAVNVYYNAAECKNTRGKGYSNYIRRLLNVLGEIDELEFVNFKVALENTTVDLYTCTSSRSKDATTLKDYHPLYPILTSRYALIYRNNPKAKDIFVLTFVGTLWLVFLVILLLLAVCLRIATWYYSKIYNGRLWSWVEITLWAIAAACQQGLSHTPSRLTSRIFFLLGYITSYVLYTAFTAAITSVLVQQETVDINIDKFNIIGYGTNGINYFGNYKIGSHTNNLTKVFKEINTGANIGLGPQILFDQYITNANTNEKNPQMEFMDDYKIITLERAIGEYKDTFFLRKGLKTQEKLLNQRLIKLFETGILQNIKQNSLKPPIKQDTIEGYSSATIEHVRSAIILFLIGLGLALSFLIMELGVYGYRHRVTEQT